MDLKGRDERKDKCICGCDGKLKGKRPLGRRERWWVDKIKMRLRVVDRRLWTGKVFSG
jgi:hypothetical protein